MLEKIRNRNDLLALDVVQQKQLCKEIREFLVHHLAETGGHLSSNLGVVELTLALHKVYDTAVDRLLFDVGHQSYVHKILTGRMEQFSSLRQLGGLAGFPKPSESDHDAFIAGHASDSVSVALGMARARTLQKENYDVVVILGDGALTGGLAYEGLNDAGQSGESLVVVLNDNGMSIKPNVGAVARHLSQMRLKPGYFDLKKLYREIVFRVPCGKKVYAFTHRIKAWMHRKILGMTLFEEMGFQYLGPVDGHDVKMLTHLLQHAKDMKEPVVLHVVTTKGKGYAPAEGQPADFHGVGSFDPDTGSSVGSKSESFSRIFGETLCDIAETNESICTITAAMEQGTGLDQFARRFPKRFFDVGIAEGHAVAMAAGLANQGMIPVFAVYSTFLQRAYDMLIEDVALSNLHVVLAVDRAGLVGEDGETHQGIFDVGYLRQIPGMQILCPASNEELRRMLRHGVVEMTGPVAIRYPRGCEGAYSCSQWNNVLHDDSEITIVTYGVTLNDVLTAAKHLKADVIKLDQITPLDPNAVIRSVRNTKRLLVVEETAEAGCVGLELLASICQDGILCQSRLLNLKNGIVPHGEVEALRRTMQIDSESILQAARELLHHENERTSGCTPDPKRLF